MIPVLSSKAMLQVEAISLRERGICALDLMEVAGEACAHRLAQLLKEGAFGGAVGFHVLAGMGNNGGDGLVIARLLHAGAFPVRVTLVRHREVPTPEHAANLERLAGTGVEVTPLNPGDTTWRARQGEVLVDCLLGTGVDRPLAGVLAWLVEKVNVAPLPVVAIDLPTGMLEPAPGTRQGLCIEAHRTLTFQVPRPALLLAGSGECAGAWELIPIGLSVSAMEVAERFAGWLEVADVRAVLPMRPRFGHKGDFGHALLMAGSTGYQGAAVLAAQGCARSGVGLFTVHGPAETVRLVGTALPDAMASVDPAPDHLTELPDVHRASAIGIGPGLGTAERTAAVVEQLLHAGQGRLVLDADALNILASKRELLGHMPPHTILTPHPKEMDRLLGGVSASAFERLLLAKRFAQEHACYIVLKGAYTATCAPHGQVYFNPTGNVGMAKGGSGDVLAGLLTGLLAQGLPPVEACLLGVYLHGLAGDLAAQHLGVDAMRASDLVRQLPAAWKQLRATAGQGL